MRSEAFAINGQVWMRLAADPQGRHLQECCFDTIDVAEELGLAILRAAVRARQQKEAGFIARQPELY